MWVQAKFSLVPINGKGEPGNKPPNIFQPSSLCKWAAYQENGPSSGWWVLMFMYVLLSFVSFKSVIIIDPYPC